MENKIQAFPIIHSRTFQSDFPTGFLFRPEFIKENIFYDCSKYILSITAKLVSPFGIRKAVFTLQNYVVAGCMGKLSEIDERLKCYSHDASGREIIAFIGVVIPKNNLIKGMVPTLNNSVFGDIFLKYMNDEIFQQSTAETHIIEECIELKLSNVKPFSEEPIVIDQKHRYFSSDNEERLFYSYLADAVNSDVSFCTNISQEFVIPHLCFKDIATSLDISILKNYNTNYNDITTSALTSDKIGSYSDCGNEDFSFIQDEDSNENRCLFSKIRSDLRYVVAKWLPKRRDTKKTESIRSLLFGKKG